MNRLDTSIIISTYNSTKWLEKVLHGYNNQTYRLFEIVIADDGSNQETSDLIKQLQKEVFYPIVHVWHEDNGFRAAAIRNKGIIELSKNIDYVLVIDGDMILHHKFIEDHIHAAEKNCFIQGGRALISKNKTLDIFKSSFFLKTFH